MITAGAWPADMKYIACDKFTGQNSPSRPVDLVSYFTKNKEPTSYGNFSLSTSKKFNGYSYMMFEMEVNSVSVRAGSSVGTRNLGRWSSGLNSPLRLSSTEDLINLTAEVVYRVYVVVVGHLSSILHCIK